jgi:trk system potassium uptake protein TrkH
MLVGGCAGSTGGGVKVIRVIILFKIIGREIKKKLHPNAVMPIKVGGKVVAENTISAVSGFLFLYFMIIAASVFIVSFEAPDFTTAFTTVVAVISNIGPGLAAVGPTLNYAFYSQGIKIFLGLLMIAGRVEIFTVFLLFTPSYWNKNK